MSLFVSFEGGEGSGKSTQVDLLTQRLQGAGVRTMQIHEPGMTALGWQTREWLKRSRPKQDTITEGAELFLFAAARAEMVSRVLKPTITRSDTVVIADRYADSTTAYQGYGRQRDLGHVAMINRVATDGTMPDLTVLLDCDPEQGLKRVRSSQMELPLDPGRPSEATRIDLEGTRRYELEPLEFHRRVRAGYLKMAAEEPDRWRVIDATRSQEEIAEVIWRLVSERLHSD